MARQNCTLSRSKKSELALESESLKVCDLDVNYTSRTVGCGKAQFNSQTEGKELVREAGGGGGWGNDVQEGGTGKGTEVGLGGWHSR